MSFQSIGDLAQGFALRRQSTTLKRQMDRLSQELASGLASDVTSRLSGDFLQLSDVKHRLSLNQSYLRGAEKGQVETGIMQTALDTFQQTTEALSLSALAFSVTPGAADIGVFANETRNALGTLISTLNVNIGGRSLFSGDEVGEVPIVVKGAFLSALQTAVAGATSAADIQTALDTFFDTPGGGFETLIYQGGTSSRGDYQLGEGESLSLDLRADDPSFRAVLKQVAIGAMIDDPGVTLSVADQFELTQDLGEALLTGQGVIANIRADLGYAEGRLDRAVSRLAAETASLELVQVDLLAVDPFETGIELENVQLRLETLYTITSRMSRLSLVNYL